MDALGTLANQQVWKHFPFLRVSVSQVLVATCALLPRYQFSECCIIINGLFPNIWTACLLECYLSPHGAALAQLPPRPRGWWSLITVSLCYSFHHFHTAIHHLFTWQLLSITLSFLQGGRNEQFYATFSFLASHSATLILFLHLPWQSAAISRVRWSQGIDKQHYEAATQQTWFHDHISMWECSPK